MNYLEKFLRFTYRRRTEEEKVKVDKKIDRVQEKSWARANRKIFDSFDNQNVILQRKNLGHNFERIFFLDLKVG